MFEKCVYSILLATCFDILIYSPKTFGQLRVDYITGYMMRCILGISQNTHIKSKLLAKDSYYIIGCPKECLFNELVKCNKADGNMYLHKCHFKYNFIIAIHL